MRTNISIGAARLIALSFTLCTAFGASAQEPAETAIPVTLSEPTADAEEIAEPRRLRKALRERGLSVGFGEKLPFSRFNGRSDVHQFQAIPYWGRFRNETQEFLWEVPLTYFTEPEKAFGAGVNLIFRQHLTGNRRFSPFVEIGPGLMLTNLNTGEISGSFQFTLQTGVGFRAALSDHSDLLLSARWYHVSNGGISEPNTGLNQSLFSVGYSRLF